MIPVGILGGTGSIGQQLVASLENHPWFHLVTIAGSEKTVGKRYGDVVNWLIPSPIPNHAADLIISNCADDLPCRLVFSALPASIAFDIELNLSKKGILVVSKASSHRMDPTVPLIVPEVNGEDLSLLPSENTGGIVTTPNCIVSPLSLALKPLMEPLGITKLRIVTMQSLSGAGLPGPSALAVMDNVIPAIDQEVRKIQQELPKVLGKTQLKLSAQCNRVPVLEGHMISVSLGCEKKVELEDVIKLWQSFKGSLQQNQLPSAPKRPIVYLNDAYSPQLKKDKFAEHGMAISIGQLSKCPVLDYSFVICSHNTIRGGAGELLLAAEQAVTFFSSRGMDTLESQPGALSTQTL